MTALQCRPATAGDAAAIWEIHSAAIREGCRNHYPASLLAGWLAAPMPADFAARVVGEGYVAAEQAGRIAGFAGLKLAAAEVDAVFVHPAYFRQGLGARLLAEVEALAGQRGLRKLSLNASLNAVAFYRAHGYGEGARGVHRSAAGLEIACVRMDKNLST